jgi:hypothetical protein
MLMEGVMRIIADLVARTTTEEALPRCASSANRACAKSGWS